ncbi:hypothetical protein J4731_19315 [Providencia rettgeri]|nr:hypothetical protein [Providencia rettgeri]
MTKSQSLQLSLTAIFCKTLEHRDQELLSKQLGHMRSYSETLSHRIERF